MLNLCNLVTSRAPLGLGHAFVVYLLGVEHVLNIRYIFVERGRAPLCVSMTMAQLVASIRPRERASGGREARRRGRDARGNGRASEGRASMLRSMVIP